MLDLGGGVGGDERTCASSCGVCVGARVLLCNALMGQDCGEAPLSFVHALPCPPAARVTKRNHKNRHLCSACTVEQQSVEAAYCFVVGVKHDTAGNNRRERSPEWPEDGGVHGVFSTSMELVE